jgi:hypothetical protein
MNLLTDKLSHKKTNINHNNNNIITFSTSWYIMKSKFPVEIYLNWIKNLLSIVNNFNLVIYTDANSFKYIVNLIDNTNKKIKIIIKPIEEFYTYKYKDYWINNNNVSDMELHKNIDWKLNMLWNEKVFLVQDTIQHKYFNSIYYGWCDIGYFRNNPNNTHTHFLNNWPNNNILMNPQFNNEFIHYGLVQNNTTIYDKLSNEIKEHYTNYLKTPPTNKYNEISFAGGFFILKENNINIYAKIYDDKLSYYFSNNYFIKDDQLIIMDIIFTNPELFYIHNENSNLYNNWFMFQRILN